MDAKAFKDKWQEMLKSARPKKGQSDQDFQDNKDFITDQIDTWPTRQPNKITQQKLNDFYKQLTGKDYKEGSKGDQGDKALKADIVERSAKLVDQQTAPDIFKYIQNRDPISVSKEIIKTGFDFEQTAEISYDKQPVKTEQLTPLQFAVLNGDTTTVKALVRSGADFNKNTPSGENLRMLIGYRSDKDRYKSEIIQILQDVEKAQSRAIDDSLESKPLDEGYGKDNKNNAGVVREVYRRKYAEAQTGKKGETPVSDTARKVEKEAKYDAEVGVRNEKYVVDPSGERKLEVNMDLVKAYNKAYDLARAKIRAKADSERNVPPEWDPEPVEDISEYSERSERLTAYNKGYSTLGQRGYDDGITGKSTSQKYSSSALGLGPELSAVIGLSVTTTEESKDYDGGYVQGVAEFVKQLKRLKDQAKINGRKDGFDNTKFKRTGEIQVDDPKEPGGKRIYTFRYDELDTSYSNKDVKAIPSVDEARKQYYDPKIKEKLDVLKQGLSLGGEFTIGLAKAYLNALLVILTIGGMPIVGLYALSKYIVDIVKRKLQDTPDSETETLLQQVEEELADISQDADIESVDTNQEALEVIDQIEDIVTPDPTIPPPVPSRVSTSARTSQRRNILASQLQPIPPPTPLSPITQQSTTTNTGGPYEGLPGFTAPPISTGGAKETEYPFRQVYDAYMQGFYLGQASKRASLRTARGGKTYRKKKAKNTKSRTYKKKLAKK